MALLEVSFKSNALDLASRMILLFPEYGTPPFPVFYLLHGLSGDCTSWTRRTSLERYIGGTTAGAKTPPVPLIVAMPETGRFWYTNAASHPPGGYLGLYEDHIIKDVLPFVDRTFPTIATREGRAIGGLSMGGYGAVKLGLKYPHLFASVTSHSGAVMTPLHRWTQRQEDARRLEAEFKSIFGENWKGGDNDPAALAEKCPPTLRPAIRLDCGTEDFLLDQNRDLHAHLTKLGFPHEYAEFPGEHNWTYWDEHIQEAIAFHKKALHLADA